MSEKHIIIVQSHEIKSAKKIDFFELWRHLMKRFFTLEYWKDDDWYVGKLKEIPGVFSQGESLEELKENIIDAYRMMMNSENEPQHEGTRTIEMGVEV